MRTPSMRPARPRFARPKYAPGCVAAPRNYISSRFATSLVRTTIHHRRVNVHCHARVAMDLVVQRCYLRAPARAGPESRAFNGRFGGVVLANVVVVGAQWGDEGKGKIVDWLS